MKEVTPLFLVLIMLLFSCKQEKQEPRNPPEFNSALWGKYTANYDDLLQIEYSVPTSKEGYNKGYANTQLNSEQINLFGSTFDYKGDWPMYTISAGVIKKDFPIDKLKLFMKNSYKEDNKSFDISKIEIDGYPTIKFVAYGDPQKNMVLGYSYIIFWDEKQTLDIDFNYSRLPGDEKFIKDREKINNKILESIKITKLQKKTRDEPSKQPHQEQKPKRGVDLWNEWAKGKVKKETEARNNKYLKKDVSP